MSNRYISCLLLLITTAVQAQDVVFVTNLNDDGPGSFRNGVAIAFSGDTVRVLVSGTITLTTGTISYNKDLVIDGPGRDNLFISGDHQVVPLEVLGGSTWMNGLTIRDGLNPYGIGPTGGGMGFTGDTLYLRDVRITGCAQNGGGGNQRKGGGLYASALKVRIYDSEFSNDSLLQLPADNGFATGGGLYVLASDILIRSTSITGNLARGRENQGAAGSYGGGLYVNGNGRIENCTIDGNTSRADSYYGGGPAVNAYASGGGLYIESGSNITVSGSSISGNALEANADGYPYYYGAGVYAHDVQLTVENSAISANTLPTNLPSYYDCQGGAVYAYDVDLTMRNCTMDGNAARNGSGLHWEAGAGVEVHQVRLERTRVLNGSGDQETAAINVSQADALRLVDVEVSGNEHRGLFSSQNDTLLVDRCLFSDNGGGAMVDHQYADQNIFLNTTFNHNGAGLGAALYGGYSTLTMANCTLMNDTLDGSNVVIDGREIYLNNSTLALRNTILSSSVFQAIGVLGGTTYTVGSAGGNIARDNSASGFLTDPTDLNNSNPQLGTFGDHGGFTRTWSLATNSTSIDQGGPDTLSVDQRGFLRDGSADAGAFEYGGVDTQTIFVNGTSPDATVCVDQELSVSVAATSSATINYQWQLDGTDISGATSTTYAVTAAPDDAGSYTCVLTTAGDTVTAGPIYIIVDVCTGIAEIATRGASVWPVPARDELWIELPDGGFTQLIVRDAMGRVVLQQRIAASAVQRIPLPSCASGLYAVEALGLDGHRAVVRFEKE